MFNLFKLFGIVGLLLIIFGVLLKKRKQKDLFFIFGGVCLEIYSIYLKDPIFIILQAVFILSAVYDYFRKK